MGIKVFSEIGKMKKVLLHFPSEELNNLTPKYLGDLLFDDIPWLPLAQKEHNAFAQVFKDHNIEVYYVENLIKQVIDSNKEIKQQFINDFINEANINSETLEEIAKNYLESLDTTELINKMISGIKRNDLTGSKNRTLTDYLSTNPFVINPMPNLYFTRDPMASLGEGVLINKMFYETRRRETIFVDYIFKFHPEFKKCNKYYDRNEKFNIEGGDVLVLNSKTIIIGASERTSSQAIEKLAKNLFYENKVSFDKILVFSMPKQRTFMHLDAIFTQVDYDKFAIHGGVGKELVVYEVSKQEGTNKKLQVKPLKGKLEEILESYIGKKITLIPCGGHDQVTADREQWSDGSNCLCIEPGVVIAYERNEITNSILEENGIKVIRIPSSELSRGRGGPRCMSMPLERELIEE